MVKYILTLFILAAIALFIFPQIDINVEQFFYSSEVGFYWKDLWWVQFLYKFVPILVYLLAGGFILFFILINCYKRKFFNMGNRELIYLLLVLIVGPGLIINVFLKDHFGRARPYQIVNFGGDKQFSRPLVVANQCNKNCSFPSGHAAIGFYFMAFALLCKRRKKTMFFLAVLFGFLVGFARMLQGGHFLSDVIFSGLITLLVAYPLYYYIIVRSSHEEKL